MAFAWRGSCKTRRYVQASATRGRLRSPPLLHAQGRLHGTSDTELVPPETDVAPAASALSSTRRHRSSGLRRTAHPRPLTVAQRPSKPVLYDARMSGHLPLPAPSRVEEQPMLSTLPFSSELAAEDKRSRLQHLAWLASSPRLRGHSDDGLTPDPVPADAGPHAQPNGRRAPRPPAQPGRGPPAAKSAAARRQRHLVGTAPPVMCLIEVSDEAGSDAAQRQQRWKAGWGADT